MATPGDPLGRVGFLDPTNRWGYLRGPVGERVYFHASNVSGGSSQLRSGVEVCYSLADGGDQLCAQVVRLLTR